MRLKNLSRDVEMTGRRQKAIGDRMVKTKVRDSESWRRNKTKHTYAKPKKFNFNLSSQSALPFLCPSAFISIIPLSIFGLSEARPSRLAPAPTASHKWMLVRVSGHSSRVYGLRNSQLDLAEIILKHVLTYSNPVWLRYPTGRGLYASEQLEVKREVSRKIDART